MDLKEGAANDFRGGDNIAPDLGQTSQGTGISLLDVFNRDFT